MTNKEVIKAWGTPEEYSAEFEKFLKEHKNADTKNFTADGLFISVTYYFKPTQVYLENKELVRRLQETNDND